MTMTAFERCFGKRSPAMMPSWFCAMFVVQRGKFSYGTVKTPSKTASGYHLFLHARADNSL